MKNNVKNALNALVLLAFMALAWATSKAFPVEVIKMEVKRNADSTAFILKNLESIDFINATVDVRTDSARQSVFFRLDSFNIKPNATDTLLFNRFLHVNTQKPFSKKENLKEFRFSVFFNKNNGSSEGLFSFNF